MTRYVHLANELRQCRYFTEEERTMHVTMAGGVTTGWQQMMPDRGSTRDMLGILRQLFGDKERGSFSNVMATLRRHADETSESGRELLTTLDSFEELRQRVLASWDFEIRTSETESPPPLGVFLDWTYGEFLHSDADKAARIQRLDGPFRLYEFQFHRISERLAALFGRFALVVEAALRTHAL